MNSKDDPSGKVKTNEVRWAEKTTIATLIKLLTIKIVAKSLFGFFNKLRISLFSFSKSSNSLALKEKYETSAPEINAEQTINNNTKKKLVITSRLKTCSST